MPSWPSQQAWGMLASALPSRSCRGRTARFASAAYGGTPGKRICELRVTRGNGEPVTFWRALRPLRFAAKTLLRA